MRLIALLLLNCAVFGLNVGLLVWNAANGDYGWVGVNAGAASMAWHAAQLALMERAAS